jgi:PmbA protein
MERTQDLLKTKGVKEWEIMALDASSLSIGVRGQEVDKFAQAESQGLAIRVLVDGRLGFSYVLGGGDDGLARAVDEARAAAGAADAEQGYSLAGPEALPPAPEIYDPALARLELPALVDMARAMAAAARAADARVNHVHPAEVSRSLAHLRLRTSRGLDLSQDSTTFSAMANALASADGQSEEGWDFAARRFLADLDVEKVGRTAGEKAAAFLGAGPVADGRYAVILTPQVAADFLELLAASLLGDNLVKGRSLLGKRLGEKIASPLVTIVDDGLKPRGLGSSAFDDEGTPASRKDLVEAGVLKGFVFDRLWGGRAGKASTGNSSRASLKAPPGVGFGNLVLSPGGRSREDLLADMGTGLVIGEIMGGHTADPVSGQFSFGAAGHLVEGGRVTRPVKSIALAGQVLELFAAVVGVGTDLTFQGKTGAPSLLVEGLSVSGP